MIMKIEEDIFDINGPPLEFPFDIMNTNYGTPMGFYWYDGEFERSNYDDKIIAEWIDIEDYDKIRIVRAAEDLNCTQLCIGKDKSGSHFFAVCFLVKMKDYYDS